MTITATLASGYDASISAVELTEAEQWATIAEPDAAFSWLPFTVEKNIIDSRFRVSRDFDIQTQAGITVTKTYYLNTETGDDGNSGLTAALPKKTWNHINSLGDCDRLIIQDGSTLVRVSASATPARNTEFIGQGTVYWTSVRAVGSWTLTESQTKTYQTTVTGGEYIAQVQDWGTLNVYGNATRYAVKTSIAGVEAAAGSFYWVGGVLYIHTSDDSDPTGNDNLKLLDSSAAYHAANITTYFENIIFMGSVSCRNASADGGAKAYFKNCTFHGAVTLHGLDETILQGCTGESIGDILNYDILNTIATKFIEIDCDFGEILGSSTSQPSTSHYGCYGVRINGNYHDTTGQAIADVLGSWSWNLACTLSDCTDGFYLDTAGAKAWLDTCTISDCSGYGINAVSSTVYTRNVTNAEGTFGTITAY